MKDGLIVENLNYKILDNVSFSLEKGTITALIGKSGSGKTMLLNCLAGLTKYKGKIKINGNIIKKSLDMSEDFGIFTGLFTLNEGSGMDNIMEPLINLGFDESKAKKKIYELSKKLGIDTILYKDINSLSYSEKKMIGIAKSIIYAPSIILLDNVFESLGINYKNKLLSYLKSIKKGIIIFTTNNSEDLLLADNIIILNEGKLIKNSTKEDIFETESIFNKNSIKLPFIIDLSHKLKSYELIDHLIYDNEEMVEELWK